MKQISLTEALIALRYGQHALVRNDGNEYLIRVRPNSSDIEYLHLDSRAGFSHGRPVESGVVLQWAVTGLWFKTDCAVITDRIYDAADDPLVQKLHELIGVPVPVLTPHQKVRIRVETIPVPDPAPTSE